MNLENIVIILSRPEESRNVGAVCRAMANSGISRLRIVGAREDFDDGRVRTLAIHAAPIWENAAFFPSIAEAASDCVLCAGTTRRRGKKRGKLLLPEEFARSCAQTFSRAPEAKIAAVFGNERTGLTEEELDECTMGVTIPSSSAFGSLNLSHAVQIVCYELFRAEAAVSPGSVPIPLGRLERTTGIIAESLKSIGFFTLNGRAEMERFWRDILSRATLSEGEAQYIEKTFAKMSGLSKKAVDKAHRSE